MLLVFMELADLAEAQVGGFLHIRRRNFVHVEQAGVKVARGSASETVVSAGRGKYLYAIFRKCLAHAFHRNIDCTALSRTAILEYLHGLR